MKTFVKQPADKRIFTLEDVSEKALYLAVWEKGYFMLHKMNGWWDWFNMSNMASKLTDSKGSIKEAILFASENDAEIHEFPNLKEMCDFIYNSN
jgi:hypothetical protein